MARTGAFSDLHYNSPLSTGPNHDLSVMAVKGQPILLTDGYRGPRPTGAPAPAIVPLPESLNTALIALTWRFDRGCVVRVEGPTSPNRLPGDSAPIRASSRDLADIAAVVDELRTVSLVSFVNARGETDRVPAGVRGALIEIGDAMLRGETFSLREYPKELSVDQAIDMVDSDSNYFLLLDHNGLVRVQRDERGPKGDDGSRTRFFVRQWDLLAFMSYRDEHGGPPSLQERQHSRGTIGPEISGGVLENDGTPRPGLT